MFSDLKGIVNGKTVGGAIATVVLIASMLYGNIQNMLPIPPQIVVTILTGIPVLFTFFGIFDSTQENFNSWVEAVQTYFKSSPAAGILLNVVVQVLNGLPLLTVPMWVQYLGFGIGGLLVVFGLKGQAVNARANVVPMAANKQRKYKIAA